MWTHLVLSCIFVLTDVPRYALVSFYGGGDHFHGNMTSCGEIFDKNAMTFAHKELPPGCLVEFRFGKRRVVGLCTDDGPYCGNREFDLSERMFLELTGNLEMGVAVVEYRIIGYKPRPSMSWNRYGTGRYKNLFRSEIEQFINSGGEHDIHKQLRPPGTASNSNTKRPVQFGWRYICNRFSGGPKEISIRETIRRSNSCRRFRLYFPFVGFCHTRQMRAR